MDGVEEGGRPEVRFGIFEDTGEGSYSLDSALDTSIPEFTAQPFKVIHSFIFFSNSLIHPSQHPTIFYSFILTAFINPSLSTLSFYPELINLFVHFRFLFIYSFILS